MLLTESSGDSLFFWITSIKANQETTADGFRNLQIIHLPCAVQFYCMHEFMFTCKLSMTGWKITNSQEDSEIIRLDLAGSVHCEANLLVIMKQMLVKAGNAGPAGTQVRHTLILALMLTTTIKSVLSLQALALWPCCWRSVGNDAIYTSGNKTGRRKLSGQSHSKAADSRPTKAAAFKSRSWVDLDAFFVPSLLFLSAWRNLDAWADHESVHLRRQRWAFWCLLDVTATPCGSCACSSGDAVTCREPPNTTCSLRSSPYCLSCW